MMNKEKEIRDRVSKDYAEAVTRASQTAGGCCGGPAPKSAFVKLAGYNDEELSALPFEAVMNAFGCGNPLAFSGVKPGDTVLDLGSGAGIDLLIAARKVGPTGRVIGVDMTDEMIAKARENIAAAQLKNVEVRKGIIEALPVEDDSVNWVISNCVINLSPEKPKVFGEIARVLTSGGTMMISDIVAEALPEEVIKSPALYSSCVAGAISERAYVSGLVAAGLVNVEVIDRLVYDDAQLKGLFASEVPDRASPASCCGGVRTGDDLISDVASSLVGKLWSAKIKAMKP